MGSNDSFIDLLNGPIHSNDPFLTEDISSPHQYSNDGSISSQIPSQNAHISSQTPSQNDHTFFQIPSPNEDTSQKKAPRSKNFSVEEDKLLVSAWLNVSLDPVTGSGQKNLVYWSRICDYFHNEKSFEYERNSDSLMNRWSAIQQEVNGFCGFFEQIVQLNRSGINEQEQIQQAKEMFWTLAPPKPHPFLFEHCWHILRFHPKWTSELDKKKKAKTKAYAIPATSSSTAGSTTNSGKNDILTPDPATCLQRPIGRKASKELLKKRKGKGRVSYSDDAVLKLQELKEFRKEAERKKEEQFKLLYDLQARSLALREREEEDRIMLMDPNGMAELQAEYIRSRQVEVMMKITGNSKSE